TGGQRHVSKRWIYTSTGGHACTVGHEDIQCIPYLVMAIQYGRFRITPHPGRAHFMDSLTESITVIERIDIFYTRYFEHFPAVFHHILTHLQLVFLDFHIHGQYG